jgi:hypothetical protein
VIDRAGPATEISNLGRLVWGDLRDADRRVPLVLLRRGPFVPSLNPSPDLLPFKRPPRAPRAPRFFGSERSRFFTGRREGREGVFLIRPRDPESKIKSFHPSRLPVQFSDLPRRRVTRGQSAPRRLRPPNQPAQVRSSPSAFRFGEQPRFLENEQTSGGPKRARPAFARAGSVSGFSPPAAAPPGPAASDVAR